MKGWLIWIVSQRVAVQMDDGQPRAKLEGTPRLLIHSCDRGPIVAGVGLSLTRLSKQCDGIVSKLGDAVMPNSTAVASLSASSTSLGSCRASGA